MNERYRTFGVKSYSSGTFGRAISNVRNHHFVTDDVGGDEVGPAEYFFAGISACAVNMVEKIARQKEIPLQWMEVSINAMRDTEKEVQERTVYDEVNVHFELWGVEEDQATELVNTWKRD